MNFEVTIRGGTSKRLPTAGKYCEQDIIIHATDPLISDLTDTTWIIRNWSATAGYGIFNIMGSATYPNVSGVETTTAFTELRIGYIYSSPADNKISTPSNDITADTYIMKFAPSPDVRNPDLIEWLCANGELQTVSQPDYRDLYQRVEYITSAEEETYPYIITDFYAENDSGVEIIASFPILQDRIPMGSRQDSGTTRFYCVYPMSANSVYYGFNTGSSVSCALKTNTVYRLQTNFLNSRLVNVYEENGTRKASASLNATLAPHTVPVSIFGYHSASSGTVTSKREYKLYSARCSKGHEIVREYIPCYRKSDGVVGVYEKITGQFLTNASTTGAFTKGADIDW